MLFTPPAGGFAIFLLCAQERTRTSTLLTALAPEASVYTISPPGQSLDGHFTLLQRYA